MIKLIQLDLKLCRKYGLAPECMNGLGEVVAITGSNGAGKSRLLRLVFEQWKSTAQAFDSIAALLDGLDNSPNAHPASNQQLAHVQAEVLVQYALSGLLPETGGADEIGQEAFNVVMRQYERTALHLRQNVHVPGDLERMLRNRSCPRVVQIINDRRNGAAGNLGNPIKNLQASSLAKLHRAARHEYMGHNPLWLEAHGAQLEASAAFRNTVSELLGVTHGWEEHGEESTMATFGGRRIVEDELSEGQRVIIRWCQLIHEEVDDLRQAIILLDEPELHLHPELLIRTFERLRALEPAQIWVATHSLPLLAHIGVRNIYEMRDGTVSWAGNRIVDVQRGLVGQDGIDRLRGFLSDAATIAFHQFAAECLLQPGVVPLRGKDPQAIGFVNHISRMLQTDAEIRVLDYAAGSGRLVEAIAAVDPEQRKNLRYHAFCDPDHTTPEQQEACRAHLARLHGDAVETFFHEDIRDRQLDTATKMHAVVLCNVLHEIPPSTWPSLMKRIRRCLRDDGYLVILEDQQMSIGELPHDKGYLVLDRIELRALLLVTDDENDRLHFTSDGRLSMAQVSAKLLDRCEPSTVKAALEKLRDRALIEVGRLRRTAADAGAEHRRGRAHAYFAMLHTNATLALG